MIYILDDTISQREKDVRYLQIPPYQSLCKIVEKPTMGKNRSILQQISKSEIDLICVHRSLRYFDDNANVLENSNKIKENFIKYIKQQGIKCVVFGRDMSCNEEQLFIDKDLLYRNLHLFLDVYNNNRNLEIGIFYDGENYKMAPRMKLLNQILDIINEKYPDFSSTSLLDLLRQYLPEQDPNQLIEKWKSNHCSKKEIKNYINEKL